MKKLLTVPLGAMLVIWSLGGCGPGAVRIRPAASSTDAAEPAATATLQASFKARMVLGNDRHRLDGALALAAPDRLYVEIAGPLGGVRAVMAAGAGRVVVLFPGAREYIEESAEPGTFESLLGLRLETSSLIDLLRSSEGACVRRIPLAPDREGIARVLLVRRQGAWVSARLESDDADPSGFRSLEWRLADQSPIDPSRLRAGLFAPAIPAGWTRVRPGAASGNLLQPR